MNNNQLLAHLKRRNIEIGVVDGKLKILDPENNVDRELLALLKSRKSDLIRIVTQRRRFTPSDFPHARVESEVLEKWQQAYPLLEDLYVATPMQSGLVFHGLDDGGASYVSQSYCDVVGSLDVEAFKRAWTQVVNHHSAFRTCFVGFEQEHIHQLVERDVSVTLIEEDWRRHDRDEIVDALALYRAQDKARGFDFGRAPLMRLSLLRLSDSRYHFIWSHHHVLSDGWCLPVVFGEVMTCYAAYCEGRPPVLAEEVPYVDYIKWLARRDTERARAFWRGQLQGVATATPLGIDGLPLDEPGASGAAKARWTLSGGLRRDLETLARQIPCTLSTVIQAAWGILLHRYSGEQDVVFGVTVSGRPSEVPGIERMVGLFINTLPLRVQVQDGLTVGELLAQLHRCHVDYGEYSYLGLGEIRSLSALPQDMALFDSLVVYENYPTTFADRLGSDSLGLQIEQVGSGDQTNFGLLLNVFDGESLTLEVSYRKERFGEATITRLLTHLGRILQAMGGEGPGLSIDAIALLDAEERQVQLGAWRTLGRRYPEGLCVHQVFEQTVERYPLRTALVFGTERWTYEQLNAQSNRLAHYLIEQGVTAETLVGVSLGRSSWMMVCLLGIQKSGGAYVPLDPAYPDDRLAYMLEDSGVLLVLGTELERSQLPLSGQRFISVDQQDWSGYPESNPALALSPHDLAYVIYTSGSTGKPKGVLVEHHTVVNFLYYSAERFLPDSINGSLVSAPLAFDGTVCTLYTPFVVGKHVELMAADDTDLEVLADYLQDDEEPLLFKVTPSHLDALLAEGCVQANAEAGHVIVVAGELLRPQTVQRWQQTYLPGSTFYNEYGPTEATVGATVYAITRPVDCAVASVPIGGPLANAELYVLNAAMQLQPVGVAGELYIGGAGLARGYLNQPKLTGERFVANPFAAEGGSRLYKTGDLVRWLPEGNLEFLGRTDQQVKLRGYRIELEEINRCLLGLAGVQDSVVVCREDAGQARRLVGYVVLSGAGEEDLPSLQQALGRQLPAYMVPSRLIALARLPLNPNGKVDRHALPVPEAVDLPMGDYVPPATPLQARLCDLWQTVLGVSRVGIHDNFFALGGDSIMSIQVASRAGREGLQVSVRQIFEYQTVGALAPHVTQAPVLSFSQAPCEGRLDLLPVQQHFFERDLAAPHHYNQSVLMTVPDGFDLATLNAVFGALFLRHDALRLRFAHDDDGWFGHFQATSEEVCSQVCAYEQVHSDTELTERCNQIQASLNYVTGPLCRAVLFDCRPHPTQLLLVVHHLVVDGVSWRILLSDIQHAWAQWKAEQRIVLPAKRSSYRQWRQVLGSYAFSEALQAQRAFWLAQHRIAVPDLPPLAPGEPARRSYSLELTEAETRALLGQCHLAYRTGINELMLAALLNAYQAWSGHNRLRLEMEGYGRDDTLGEIDTTETVGWFTSLYPLVLAIKPGWDIEQIIKSVKEQYRLIPQHGLGYGVLRYLANEPQLAEAPGAQMTFNYLGRFVMEGQSEGFALSSFNGGRAISEQNRRAVPLGWNGAVYDGVLRFDLAVKPGSLAHQQAQALVDLFEKALKHSIEHCLETNKNSDLYEQHFSIMVTDESRLKEEGIEI